MIDKLTACSHRKILAVFFLAALSLVLPLVFWQVKPTSDGCFFYLPMIQAFTRFDWNHAYYPMICPFFSTIRLNSFMAMSSNEYDGIMLRAKIHKLDKKITCFFMNPPIKFFIKNGNIFYCVK